LKNAEDLKITIITVCKNSEGFLDETIKSVINQTYKNVQYIIIDGNSTDGTVEIIKKHSARISFWLSEEDGGMYNAINKGLKHSTGNYILILNSDDVLASDETVKNVVRQIENERLDYYYGNIIKSKNGKDKKVKLFPVSFKQLLLSTHGTFVPHPCFLISAELNNKLNGYDQQYKYASDYDYILRALSAPGSKGKYIDGYISKFRIHENSITAGGNIDIERKTIIQRHGYFQYNYFSRWASYYTLWIYYKLINLGQGYKEAQV
jgi:glycosyltransferase involved in cell wall biosynthesis